VFVSQATNLLPGPRLSHAPRIYRRDLAAGVTSLVSTSPVGGRSDEDLFFDSSVSGNGRMIAYETDSDAVDGGFSSGFDVVVYDVDTDSTTLVSRPASGQPPDSSSLGPAISDDGSTIAFVSAASNLVAGDTNGYYDAFAYDVVTGAITMITTGVGGGPADGDTSAVAIDGDGTHVAVGSAANNLAPGDDNRWRDVFVYDMTTGSATVVSHTPDGHTGSYHSDDPSIAGDGSVVAYWSYARDLGDEPLNVLARSWAYQVY
jgi:hypothetical protein